MGNRWYEIPEKKRAEIIERHKRGDSFSKIAEALKIDGLKIDRRQVARIVREGETMESGRLIIRHDELVQLFRTHLADMKKAAEILLDGTVGSVASNSLLPLTGKISDALNKLTYYFKADRRISYLRSRGMDPEAYSGTAMTTDLSDAVELRLARRRANAAFEGLKAHVEEYQQSLQGWKGALNAYRNGWGELSKQASTVGIASSSVEQTVRTALEHLPEADEEESLPRYRGGVERDIQPEKHYHKLLHQPDAKRALIVFRQSRKDLEQAYNNLEAILSSPKLDNALVIGHCQYCPVP